MKSPSFIGTSSDDPRRSPREDDLGGVPERLGFPSAGTLSAPVGSPGPRLTSLYGEYARHPRPSMSPRGRSSPGAASGSRGARSATTRCPPLKLLEILDEFGDRGEAPSPKQVLLQGSGKP